MHELIAWAGFVGGWLLFAGPLYQAAIELEEEETDVDALRQVSAAAGGRPRISPWWWLVPPVAYARQRRRSRAHRDAMLRSLTREGRVGLIRLRGKSAGWAFVSGGAFLIAVKETWELHEAYGWSIAVWAVLVVVMLVVSALHTVLRMRQGRELVGPGQEQEQEREQEQEQEQD